MGTFVTLAEVLEARGSPLDEDEVWCLLLATTEALLDISKKGKHSISSFVDHVRLEKTLNTVALFCLGSGNMCNVLSPGLVLLSASGSLAFKSCARYEDVASYKAPEVRQGHTAFSSYAATKVGKLRDSKDSTDLKL